MDNFINLNKRQMQILLFICKRPTASPAQIMHNFNIKRSTVSVVLKYLWQQKLIKLNIDENGKRYKAGANLPALCKSIAAAENILNALE